MSGKSVPQPPAPSWPIERSDRRGSIEVVFAAAPPREGGSPPGWQERWPTLTLAWNRQVHSARVVAAEPDRVEDADGLWTGRARLGLVVVTADCVPLLLTDGERVAAVHAGWRGLASGVITEACERLVGDPASWTAWIGPSIGPCCYEVGEEVALQVAAGADSRVVLPAPAGAGPRPHLDLSRAARIQLHRCGIEEICELRRCTRCGDQERWWSYRREGAGAGRNIALIWRR